MYLYMCMCVHACLLIMVCVKHVFVCDVCIYDVHVQHMFMRAPTYCMYICGIIMWYILCLTFVYTCLFYVVCAICELYMVMFCV